MSYNRVVLMPKYLREFNCIGEGCEDNCCYGWRVDINKNVYQKYRKVSGDGLKTLLDKNVKRNRSNASEETYAKIKMDNMGQCPFLDENKLCKIHKNFGTDYLSKVCTTYPRETNVIDNQYERAASLSCPEVARIALLNTAIMEFDEVEEAVDAHNIIKYNVDNQNIKKRSKISKYFWEMRIFSISLIQNRNLLLGERLIILGLFMQKAAEYVKNETTDNIPDLILQYGEVGKSGTLKEDLANIPTSLAIQMELMKEIYDQRLVEQLSANANSYVNCVIEFLHGIRYEKENTVEDIAKRYKDAYDIYYEPFMKGHEYILENYLVNHMFKELFPILSKEGIFEDYVKLIVHYSYIKTLLIGMAAFNKKLDEAIIIRLVYSFSRAIDHNKIFLNNMFNILKSNGFNTMGYMSILIKN